MKMKKEVRRLEHMRKRADTKSKQKSLLLKHFQKNRKFDYDQAEIGIAKVPQILK